MEKKIIEIVKEKHQNRWKYMDNYTEILLYLVHQISEKET